MSDLLAIRRAQIANPPPNAGWAIQLPFDPHKSRSQL
jgi:hypothetical protein